MAWRVLNTLQGVSLYAVLLGHIARLSTTCILPRHGAWKSCNLSIIEACLLAGDCLAIQGNRQVQVRSRYRYRLGAPNPPACASVRCLYDCQR